MYIYSIMNKNIDIVVDNGDICDQIGAKNDRANMEINMKCKQMKEIKKGRKGKMIMELIILMKQSIIRNLLFYLYHIQHKI